MEKQNKTKLSKFLFRIPIVVSFYLLTLPQAVYANKLTETTLFKGVEQLLQDATAMLVIIIPIAGIVMILFNLLKKLTGDEHEAQRATHNMKSIALWTVVGTCVTAVINVLLSYFS